jgi:peptidoglycan/LPS O-acetylase OafA/YrhL
MIVLALASWQLAMARPLPVHAAWAAASGVSLFVLTGLVHEASHRLLSRSAWLNEVAGNLAGWMVLTPLTAYRAFHLRHHQRTNREDDPNALLNSRWMLGLGSIAYVILIHRYALKNLRGRALTRYAIEVVAMAAFLAALAISLPRAVRERSWLLPMSIVVLLQNVRIVTEHLDLPAGRYRDTWQLVLPGWLSRWLLHYDHHLEHHLRPGLHWHELPRFRDELRARAPGLGLHRVTLPQFFRDVFPGTGAATARGVVGRPTAPADAELPSNRPGAAPATSSRRPEGTGPGSPSRIRLDLPPPPPHPLASPEPRYHGLDALRAATMLLVVVLHAALAYAPVPIPNLIWVVRDPDAHWTFDLLSWWALGISSPFFLMSGFFAADLHAARGPRAFLINRARRVVVPFLVGGSLILPATFFVWVGGWIISGNCSPREFLRMKFHAKGYQHNLYGPAHLWSLEYLAVMLAAYWCLLQLRSSFRWRGDGLSRAAAWVGRRLASPWRPFVLAVPTTLILWAGRRHVGIDAIMDRQNSFIPEIYRLSHNALFFAVGVVLHRHRGSLLPRLATGHLAFLALSLPVFSARAWLIRRDLNSHLSGPAIWALAATGSLFTWLITFGFLGLAMAAFRRPRPFIRYLADSSYWIYLCHLPIVGLLQVDLRAVRAPAPVKFLGVLTAALLLGVTSYHVMIRHTILGSWLHGRRERGGPGSRSGGAIRRPSRHIRTLMGRISVTAGPRSGRAGSLRSRGPADDRVG